MKIDAAEIKARVSLQELMERDGHKFQHAGGGLFQCRCMFHNEKSPSFTLYPDQHFFCFGCHASGDVIGYVMRRDGIKFKEAIEKLSGGSQASSTFRRAWTPPPAPRETPPLAGATSMIEEWMRKTDFDDLDLFAFELGVSANALASLYCCWAPEHGAWAFPMRDSSSLVVGIRLRNQHGKKWAVKGSKEGLFIASCLTSKSIVICEGPTDCAAGLTMGLNIVGRPSCQGAIKELVALVQCLDFKEVIIISDNDAPGLAGSDRLEQHLPCPYRELVLPCKDLREFLNLGGTKQLIESMAAKQIPRRKPKR